MPWPGAAVFIDRFQNGVVGMVGGSDTKKRISKVVVESRDEKRRRWMALSGAQKRRRKEKGAGLSAGSTFETFAGSSMPRSVPDAATPNGLPPYDAPLLQSMTGVTEGPSGLIEV